MTNVNVSIDQLLVQAGSDYAVLTIDASGVLEPNTVATNVITLLSATGSTNVSGFVVFK
jgi:hypothetical protein